MPPLVILADEPNGAADTSACFAAAGLDTVIRLSDTTVSSADVVAVSTDYRDSDQTAATDAVHKVGHETRSRSYQLVQPHEIPR